MSKINVTSLRPRSLLHWTGLPVKAFLALVAWRTNLTNRQLSDLFGVGVATVHRIIDRLTPLIAQLLDPPDDRRSELWVVDGTLIPLHDQTKTAKSKNYRRSVNVRFTFRARDRRVMAVGDAWPGNRNDIIVFRATMAEQVAGHRLTIGDGAYRSAPEVITSRNKSKPFAKRRARAEHGIARLKDYQVLRQHRRRGDTINQTSRAVAALHNLKIDHA
ncbi:transposase [Streptomyces sp. ISL-96]|uniref:transposase family protein n=1 Tax=Streptomyces sp. ISL-96 TaxID=2819191 RepID=UPI001BE8DC78|nr:transposase family protein [Streptomyces sp. ISL-96]MBT2491237.1 transposase [Streptomyces sp. ISL-96]